MATTLTTETRTDTGKNAARRLRRRGMIPGVVYGDSGDGKGRDSVAVSVDPSSLTRILMSDSGVNTIIGLSVDSAAETQVLIKDYQVHPLNNRVLHVDFLRVAMDQVLTVTVPIELTGEAEGVKLQGGLIDFVHREIAIECLPTEIPEHLTIDISPLVIGQGVRVRDLLEGVSWKPVTDPDTLIVHVIAPRLEEEPASEDEAAEGAEPTEAGAEKSDKGDEGGKEND